MHLLVLILTLTDIYNFKFQVELGEKPGRMSDNYLKDERLYKVLHDRHYDGIGPVDSEEQIPMALRSVRNHKLNFYVISFYSDG